MEYLLLALLLALGVFAVNFMVVNRRKVHPTHHQNESEVSESQKEPSEKAPPEDTPRNV